MRAIIIDDKDAASLLERLQLIMFVNRTGAKKYGKGPADVNEVHRWFHYVVCSWLQEQGAKLNHFYLL